MAIRNVIVRGRKGFAAGEIRFLFTRGLGVASAPVFPAGTAPFRRVAATVFRPGSRKGNVQ